MIQNIRWDVKTGRLQGGGEGGGGRSLRSFILKAWGKSATSCFYAATSAALDGAVGTQALLPPFKTAYFWASDGAAHHQATSSSSSCVHSPSHPTTTTTPLLPFPSSCSWIVFTITGFILVIRGGLHEVECKHLEIILGTLSRAHLFYLLSHLVQ